MFRKCAVLGMGLFLSLALLSAAFGAPRSLEAIQESGTFRIAVADQSWGLFRIWEGDQLKGFEIDLCNTIAEALGVTAEYVPIPWGQGEEGSITGALGKGIWRDWDMIASGATITKERQEVVNFADWMFNAGQVLVVRKDSGIKTMEDAAGKKIGAQENTASLEVIGLRLQGAEAVPFEIVQDGFDALLEGSLQGFVIDAPLAVQEAKLHPDTLEVLERPITRERLGLVLPKDCDPKLLDAVSEIVVKERKGLYEKWFD